MEAGRENTGFGRVFRRSGGFLHCLEAESAALCINCALSHRIPKGHSGAPLRFRSWGNANAIQLKPSLLTPALLIASDRNTVQIILG